MLALATLVSRGQADRPPVHAYLQHPEWRKIWVHLLDTSGIVVQDDFQALENVRELESAFFRAVEGQ